ncbi:MAG: PAS domain S-box protein [Deltaproteobacteria bacterium]|nr:PAS domain S-box protein [Deltaproteobacteria bacterium]
MSDSEIPTHGPSSDERNKERARLDEALRGDQLRLIQILSTLRAVVWLRDARTSRILYVNPAYETVWGRSCQSLYDEPMSFLDAVHSQDKQKVLDAIERLRNKQGQAFNEEYRILRPDGSQRWVWGRILPILDESGEVIRLVSSVEDITDQKRVEQALRESEQRFRALFEQAAVGTAEIDSATGRFLHINRRYCEILGYDREEASNLTFQAVTHEEDLGKDLAQMRRLMDGGIREFSMEKRYIRKDGKVVWVTLSVSALWPPGEKPTTHIAVVQDVTERKEAEMATRHALALQAATLESTADGILVVDVHGKILSYNRNFARLWGIPETVLATRDDQTAIEYVLSGLEDPAGFVRRVGELYAQPDVESYDTILLKQGRVFERYSSPFRMGDAICGRVWSFRDATDRMAADNALRESEARYRELSDHSPLPVVVAALEGGAVLYINQRAADLFESSVDKLPDLNAVDFWVSPEARQRYVDAVKQVGYIVDYEARLRTTRGREFLALLSANSTVFEGQRAIHVTVVDITDRRRMEQELIKSQKLESLAILAGGIAHDFNNLLTGILGNISLAQMQLTSPAIAQDRLNEAAGAAMRARGLTQQLLTFSRGGAPVKRISDVARVVREAALFATRGSSVACQFDFAPDLWPAEVDEGQIAQVIQNLVINAVEAMPSGGVIAIGAENLPLRREDSPLLDPGPYVRIRVKDEGVGIAENLLQRVFDPYFTTKQRGSGLGLSICHSIVTRHQGSISVSSRPQSGTMFEVLLPATPGDMGQERAAAVSGVRGEGRVLLMDDEEVILQMTARILETIGYQAATARDGKDAIEQFLAAREAGSPFDVVILDLTVPGGMGGLETLARMREIEPEVKAVVSSGYSNDPVMSDFRAHGFAGVLIKPYQIADVAKVMVPLAPAGRAERSR